MRNRTIAMKSFGLLFAVMLLATVVAAGDPPASVAGKWTFAVTGGAGNATQAIEFQQDGGKLTGTFKGPRQSGTLTGTVDGNAIKFHVVARVPIDYTGTVSGDTMKGTLLGDNGKAGDWTAKRD